MTKTILVIEDDASIATMLEDVLSGAGFEVLREADGEWGLRTFEAQRPDIVITDVLLPKLQGFDLIPKIRAVAPHVPIIVTSGVFRGRTYADDMKARFAIRAYFDKPLDVDALLEAVRTSDEAPPVPRLADPKTDEPPLLPLELKGDVADVSFGRLVGGLFARRATGALMLRRSSVKKIVYFVEGVPVFVKSNLLSECLGRVMVSERLITQDECDRSL
ncbi:MAG: response regulator, partial [Deltaproteobacteria bacterium]